MKPTILIYSDKPNKFTDDCVFACSYLNYDCECKTTDIIVEKYAGVIIPDDTWDTDGDDYILNSTDKALLTLLDAFIEQGKTVLGIGKGMHLLNIYYGGTLHRVSTHTLADNQFHSITTKRVNRASQKMLVNSNHEFAIDKLGENVEATARADDSNIEAIFSTKAKVFGVQWNPEKLLGNTNNNRNGTKVFKIFKQKISEGTRAFTLTRNIK